jgi:hypothetical protein
MSSESIFTNSVCRRSLQLKRKIDSANGGSVGIGGDDDDDDDEDELVRFLDGVSFSSCFSALGEMGEEGASS